MLKTLDLRVRGDAVRTQASILREHAARLPAHTPRLEARWVRDDSGRLICEWVPRADRTAANDDVQQDAALNGSRPRFARRAAVH